MTCDPRASANAANPRIRLAGDVRAAAPDPAPVHTAARLHCSWQHAARLGVTITVASAPSAA
jgi:hypothetical protein